MTGSPAGQVQWLVHELASRPPVCSSICMWIHVRQLLHHVGCCLLWWYIQRLMHSAKANHGCSLATASVAHKLVLTHSVALLSLLRRQHPVCVTMHLHAGVVCRHGRRGMQTWYRLWGGWPERMHLRMCTGILQACTPCNYVLVYAPGIAIIMGVGLVKCDGVLALIFECIYVGPCTQGSVVRWPPVSHTVFVMGMVVAARVWSLRLHFTLGQVVATSPWGRW
jgi:hypothetical protein